MLADSEAGKLPHYSAVLGRKKGAQILTQGLPSLGKEKAKNTYPRKLLLPLSVFPVLFKAKGPREEAVLQLCTNTRR